MGEKFVGKWNLESSENFDDFLKEIGVSYLTRKAGACIKPVLEFEVNGNKWKMTSTSTFITISWEFELGQEKEVKTADGRVVKTTFTFVDGKLIENQKKTKAEEKDSYYERYVDADGKLMITMDCDGVKAKRVYIKA
ncbi:hypothetical protein niasHS_005280 [Heterodera schachtii]|uniref:Cytosolic fatty-acid binding proteins domain-containing protein n=2 Tax=Heterodera TaxID=34509 RepID=A0ABD2ISE2_9BILA